MAKHLAGRKMMRELVNRGGGETIARVQRLLEVLLEKQCTGIVYGWIAQIERDGIVAVLLSDCCEFRFD